MSPEKLKKNMSITGTSFVDNYTFRCGNVVPIYDVSTMHGLNQILGHLKFNNREFGDVYYRGQCKLYDSLIPSLFRKWDNEVNITLKRSDTLGQIINKMKKSPKIAKDLKLGTSKTANRWKVEGILQHYGVPTRCIDLVDNHWIALWMGLYECEKQNKVSTYYHFKRRELPIVEMITGSKMMNDVLYQYVLLLALPYGDLKSDGITMSDDYVVVDLRKALSSVFLRPHAQHGIVAAKNVKKPKSIDDYDMASSVVGILRLRIDNVAKWLGEGLLVTQENLFPPPSMDKGYDQLLTCQDMLVDHYELAKFV